MATNPSTQNTSWFARVVERDLDVRRQVRSYEEQLHANQSRMASLLSNWRQQSIFQKATGYFRHRGEIGELESRHAETSGALTSLRWQHNKYLADALVMRSESVFKSHTAAGRYRALSKQHAQLQQVHQRTSDVVSKGERAIREVKSALSSLDSAQVTETLDLVFDNSLASAVSTATTMGASSDLSSAKSAIRRFNDSLQEYEKFVTDIGDILGIELVDLALDLTSFNSVFDFGSVISLFTLFDTSDKLKDTKRQLEEVLEPYQRRSKEEQRDLETLYTTQQRVLTEVCDPVFDEARSVGLEVSAKLADTVIHRLPASL